MKHSPEMGVERPSGPASAHQLDFIERHDLLRDLDVSEDVAERIIGNFIKGRRKLKPTPRQEALLRQKGKWREGMTRGEAFDALGRLFAQERLRQAQQQAVRKPGTEGGENREKGHE